MASDQSPWSASAEFAGPQDRTLIRRLHSSGAMFVANYIVLHAFGLAFGVETVPAEEEGNGAVGDEQRVTEMFVGEAAANLWLFATDDPEGIVFDDNMKHDGLMKLSDEQLEAMRSRASAFLDDIARTLAERTMRRAEEAREEDTTGATVPVVVKGGPLNDHVSEATREMSARLPLPDLAAAIPADGGSLVPAPQPVPATVGVYHLTGEAEYTWIDPQWEERPRAD